MKKHLLLGSALLAAISAYPQNGRQIKPTGITNMGERLAQRFNFSEEAAARVTNPAPATNVVTEEPTINAKSSAATTVTKMSGSMNIYGMLVSSSKPLQWNDNVDAVSFIHRKSATYVASPANNSGAIVAMLTTNMGGTWDSTCIWSNGSNLARYPQGGIYNPPGNTNYNNAYVVGTGPVTGGSGWLGNWYASKSVSLTPKNTPSADQQFFANTGPFGAVGKHDFSRYSMSFTDDGMVRSLGSIYTDANGTTNATQLFRGVTLVKGAFSAGAFVWTTDSFLPPLVSRADGSKQGWSQPLMAWNEQGTVGYVVIFGARTGQTGSNMSWQPIIYKTTNSGTSWTLLNAIDFNNANMSIVKNSIAAINTNSNMEVPFFNVSEGQDVTVDAGNNLHIFSTVVGAASQHPDSVDFTFNFGSQATNFPYQTGAWPYIFDFVGNGTGLWRPFIIDSMATEGPSGSSTGGGFAVNPWNTDANGSKVSSDSRIQVSRNPGADRISVIWAEDDTTLTSSKYIQFPNLKARLICAPGNGTISVDPNITNITSSLPASTINNRVKGKSYFHYVSPKMKPNGTTLFEVPVSVSNSVPLDQLGANDHFFIKAEINNFACLTAIDETKANSELNYGLMPNPAKGAVNVSAKLVNASSITVNVYNMVGQLVKATKADGQVGENIVNVNLEGLTSGIYMVKVSANGKTSTQKLVVE